MALQVFSGKVTPEVAEQFKAAQENSEAQTFNAFMEMLLEAFLNPKTKSVEVFKLTPEQEQLIEDLKSDLQAANNQLSIYQSNAPLVSEELENLRTENSNLKRQLESQPAPAIELADDHIILTIPPIMSAVLDIEKEVAQKKTHKEWTIGDLLLNNFWESIKNGVSYPFRIWSSTELARLATQIKEIETDQQQ